MAALAHRDAAFFIEQRIGKTDAIGFEQQLIGALMAAADHGTVHQVGHFKAEIGADLEDYGLEHGLGVEQGAVHIEDGGLKGCKLYHLA